MASDNSMNEKPKPRKKNPATPVTPVTSVAPVAPPVKIPRQELEASVWGRFALFCNDSYEQFIPKDPKLRSQQSEIASIHNKAAENFSKLKGFSDWSKFIKKHFLQNEWDTADNFYTYASKKTGETPEQFWENINNNLKKFTELAHYAFIPKDDNEAERDLLKISEFNDAIDYFHNSSEKIYLLLYFLPEYLDKEAKEIVINSAGYQKLKTCGANHFLKGFCFHLQKRFRITRTAMKDETAQNLLRELGEVELNLKNQIFFLKEENEQLNDKLEQSKKTAFETSVYDLAKSLQSQPQPVLDQLVDLCRLLDKLSQEGMPLSNTDSLRCLITLESLLKAFKDINITQFPNNIHESFQITTDDLNEFSYVKGSAFINPDDKKIVRCIGQGWKVGDKIVTPARVEEIAQ